MTAPALPVLAICVPAQDHVPTPFCISLTFLLGHTINSGAVERVALNICQGTLVQDARYRLAEGARQAGATHVLWLDSDATFPPDTAVRLLEHGQPIVAANAVYRTVPTGPTAVKCTAPDTRVYTLPESTGLEAVEMVGMHVMLTAVEIFDRLPPPWFTIPWDAARKQYVSEDAGFVQAARAAGYPVYIDHDLSKQVGHVGSFTYTQEHALQCRGIFEGLLARRQAASPTPVATVEDIAAMMAGPARRSRIA